MDNVNYSTNINETKVEEKSFKDILDKLIAGEWLHDIVTDYHLNSDSIIEASVRYAASLPKDHPLSQLYQSYLQRQTKKIHQILRQLKQHAEAVYGDQLSQMILFGSQARGDAWPGSDIDVLVVFKNSSDPYKEGRLLTPFIADISIETGELISCIYMNEERFLHSRESLLEHVRCEGIQL